MSERSAEPTLCEGPPKKAPPTFSVTLVLEDTFVVRNLTKPVLGSVRIESVVGKKNERQVESQIVRVVQLRRLRRVFGSPPPHRASPLCPALFSKQQQKHNTDTHTTHPYIQTLPQVQETRKLSATNPFNWILCGVTN